MPYWVSTLLEFSIIISVIISFQKLSRIRKDYLPFVISLWCSLLGSVISEISIFLWRTNVVSSNFYFIIFCLLILWQFKRWGLFGDKPIVFYSGLGFFIVVWAVDNFIVGTLFNFNPYARIINSMVIVLLSIQLLSSELAASTVSFWKSSIQLILVSYIVLFTVKIVTEFFWQYGMRLGDSFMINIYFLYFYTNFATNLLFTIALLWIPVTTRYSWLSR
jgi:hypothetical protein